MLCYYRITVYRHFIVISVHTEHINSTVMIIDHYVTIWTTPLYTVFTVPISLLSLPPIMRISVDDNAVAVASIRGAGKSLTYTQVSLEGE